MNVERDAKTKRGILITVIVVAGLALMFYVLFIAMHV